MNGRWLFFTSLNKFGKIFILCLFSVTLSILYVNGTTSGHLPWQPPIGRSNHIGTHTAVCSSTCKLLNPETHMTAALAVGWPRQMFNGWDIY